MTYYLFAVIFLSVPVLGHPNHSLKQHYYPFLFCSRDCWGAAAPTNTRALSLPVPYVVIHHTAVPAACDSTDQCKADMRSMQSYHNSMGWGDIGYHFCVGGEGVAYEGRGWDVTGIHAGRANNHSIGICLIGDWRVELPPSKQLATTKALISSGVRSGFISPEYKLIGHNQVMATECPGGVLLDHISTWDHFVPGHIEFRKH